MVQALVLLVFGIGGSILGLTAGCTFITQVLKIRSEQSCQFRTYLNWIMQKGTPEQKEIAVQMHPDHDLPALRRLVGISFLVDR